MTTKEKFHAAVNVIRGLPKRGSYQPSNELMLRFYSYYKQATEGKCNISKPGFWDIVNRAKWEAWNKLGDMSSDQAMEAYVEELHKIVETMSYTDNVAAFFETMDDNTDIPISKNDLYLVAGDVFKKTSSSPSTPTGTRDSKPLNTQHYSTYNGYIDSEDEYIDTEEHEDVNLKHKTHYNVTIPNGHAVHSTSEYSSVDSANVLESSNRVIEELRRTVIALERDMSQLKNRLDAIDKEEKSIQKSILFKRPSWWPRWLKGLSPALLTAIILWPVIANRVANSIRKKK